MHLMGYYSGNTRRRPLQEPTPQRLSRVRSIWFTFGILSGVVGSLLVSQITTSALPETPEIADISSPEPVAAVDTAPLVDSDNEPQALDPQPEVVAISWPRQVDVKMTQGDNLLDLLTGQNIAFKDAYDIVQSIKPKFNVKKLREGTQIALNLVHDDARPEPEAAKLMSMKIFLSPIEELRVDAKQQGEGYTIILEREKTTPKISLENGEINSSLYVTAVQSGLSDSMINEVIRAYSYDVDFERDIQAGDHFEVMFEKLVTADGDIAGSGKLLYTNLTTRGKEMKLYPFEDQSGHIRFYNEKGISVIKQLLRTPLDVVRITSGFGMRRHPILGYSRMHRGVDFAASQGTPILAAGDGTISFAGRKAGYGNYVSIKHNNSYETAYAHASRFARGIRNGAKVRQGQVVAYVGMTGMATGPHLHYEIRKAGAQVNPANVKFMGNDRLGGRQLAQFKQHIANIDRQIATMGGEGATEEVAEAR